ncbi:hypothetical protein SASPL_127999 [Salvia splendens]|uniref:Uncharacterized protein n=1 Tax=Salvia splendens TaxID=180675 RepID=A0A8X8XCY3_SALSN|nr:hypothetical protein SASPL_127999 [Salvia splendens]
MEYIGLKVARKDFGGRAACFGTVVAFSSTTSLFRVAFDGGGGDESVEMQLTELYPLFLTPSPPGFGPMPRGEGSSGGIGADLENPRESVQNCDLNAIDLNVDVDGGGGGGLHGLDLNEGVNYILNGEIDSTSKSREIDLNLDLNEAAEESSTTAAKIDLNEQASPMEIDDREKAAVEDDDDDCVIIPAPSHHVGGGRSRWRRNYRTNPDAESRRLNAMPSFTARDYELNVAHTQLMQIQAVPSPPPPEAYLLGKVVIIITEYQK